MILILTDKNDIHADILIQKLQNESVNYFRFDLDTFSLEKTKVSFENYEWIIDIEEDQINLNQNIKKNFFIIKLFKIRKRDLKVLLQRCKISCIKTQNYLLRILSFWSIRIRF